MSMILILILLALWTTNSTVTQLPKRGQKIRVEGNVNQTTQINIPFEHVVTVTVQNDKFKENLAFSPNRFRLQSIKQSNLLPRQNTTLVYDLRTPFTNQFTHIFNLGGYFYVFKMPNTFLVLQQYETSFVLKRQFSVPQIRNKNLKFQVINNEFMFIYLSKQKLVVIRPDFYAQTENIFATCNVVTSRGQLLNDDMNIFLTFFNQTLYLVKVTSNSLLTLKNEISLGKQYKFTSIKVIHVDKINNKIVLWILDRTLGLFWAKLSLDFQILDEPHQLLHESGCYQMDILPENEIKILLTCSSSDQIFFIKSIYLYQNHKPILLKQWTPHIESCKTKRFIFYDEHIFSLQRQSIDVFLPSIYKGEQQHFYIKNWINLAGHSAYWINQDLHKEKMYLYSINDFKFTKSQLILEDYSLQIKSGQELSAKFNLTVEYLCSGSQARTKQICIYQTEIEVDLHSKNLSFVQYRSINIAIILLVVTVIAALSFICYSKYKALEFRALQNLKSITNPKNFKL